MESNKRQIKEEILRKISRFYDNFDDALVWYKTPNMYFGGRLDKRNQVSPQEMVDNDKGHEVLDWINKAMGLK